MKESKWNAAPLRREPPLSSRKNSCGFRPRRKLGACLAGETRSRSSQRQLFSRRPFARGKNRMPIAPLGKRTRDGAQGPGTRDQGPQTRDQGPRTRDQRDGGRRGARTEGRATPGAWRSAGVHTCNCDLDRQPAVGRLSKRSGTRFDLLPRRVCCSWPSAMPVQHARGSEQAQEHTSPIKN